ncbi:MAG: iron ABC transporter permease, partial [Flavobacteriales bacterium]|nr:iron ABC transporter permease [Flavobacteriales bacterium]
MRSKSVILLLIGTLVFVGLIDLFLGNSIIGLPENSKLAYNIFLKLRLPQTLTAISAGAGLAMAGLMLQILFKNYLAGPSVIGITSGSNLGVSILIFLPQSVALGSTFFSEILHVIAAMAGATVILIILLIIEKRIKGNATLLIVGLMISFFSSALVSALEHFGSAKQVQKFVFWGFGSLSTTNFYQIGIVAVITLLIILIALRNVSSLKLFEVNENLAKRRGYSSSRIRSLILVSSGLIVSVITAFCGPIAFIGLSAPILTRMLLKTPDLRLILICTAIIGAILLTLGDIFSKTPWQPGSLPINVVTSLIGAPIILWLLTSKRN